MREIYIRWMGGTSSSAFLEALEGVGADIRSIKEVLKTDNFKDNSKLAVEEVLQYIKQELNCDRVVSSTLEIDENFDVGTLSLMKNKKVRLVTDRKCTHDFATIVFAAATQGDFASEEGKLIAVGTGRVEGVQVNAIIVEKETSYERDTQYIVECNIDDMNSEGYDYIFNRLLENGALDVFITPIIMKKGRPAVKLTVLCRKEKLTDIQGAIFKETSTFGLRSYKVDKTMLSRSFGEIQVYGEVVRVKYGYFKGEMIKFKPEYEDCKKIAQKLNLGINNVYLEALKSIERDRD